MHVQRGSRLHLGRKHLRKRIDACQLFARRPGLFLRVVSHDLHQRSVQRLGWLGIVLHERLHGWDDVCVEHESSDLCRRV